MQINNEQYSVYEKYIKNEKFVQCDGEFVALWKFVQNDSGEEAVDFVSSPLYMEKSMSNW